MNPEITTIIVGPPGTGKTHELLSITEGLLESGVAPQELAFVAFTRKAANEARERACVKFRMESNQLPWFRTLHSLAFTQLALAKHQVMGYGDYVKIAQMLGLVITFRGAQEDGTVVGLSKGDRLFFMENMARATLQPLKEYWASRPDEDIYWYELQQLSETLVRYKKENGKQDFTDMIVNFCSNPVVPNIRALILDEAQDLTPLQWRMADHLSKDVDEIYVAGDDDQAIFRWAGADTKYFINLQGNRRVLPQSYRVPLFIQGIAERVVSRIDERIPKEWLSTKEHGAAEFMDTVDQIDMSEGTWLLLARNVFLLEAYNAHCIQEGLVFTSHLGSPVKGNSMGAIRSWETLRRGESIRGADACAMYAFIGTSSGHVERGFKKIMDTIPDDLLVDTTILREKYGLRTDKIWHEALDLMNEVEREYFIAALRRGEKLLKEPRIRIETIHGVKGGEADNVVVMTDMAQRTYDEYQKNPDDEHRVFYVAVTRAKKKLFILASTTKYFYEI